MYIDDQKWDNIITETKAGIDRWNGIAAERGVKSVFRLDVKNIDDDAHSIIVTEHATDYHEWKAWRAKSKPARFAGPSRSSRKDALSASRHGSPIRRRGSHWPTNRQGKVRCTYSTSS